MNNIELEARIRKICAIDNYFDLIDEMYAFEKEYKNSDFYKKYKKPLSEVVREARIHYMLQLKDLGDKIQLFIDNLSFENLNDILDKISKVFGEENADIKETLEVFKDLKG